MSPERLIAFVESKVPLIPTESEHRWQLAILVGCAVCGTHEGYECTVCHRCVDYECDTKLAAAIGSILALEVLD